MNSSKLVLIYDYILFFFFLLSERNIENEIEIHLIYYIIKYTILYYLTFYLFYTVFDFWTCTSVSTAV